MDDIQTILYIAIGVIYLLARVLKRKKAPLPQEEKEEATVTESQERREASPQRKKPLSFEELIREISGEVAEAQQEPEEMEAPTPKPQKKRPLVSDAEAKATYQESIKQAQRIKKKETSQEMARTKIFENYELEDQHNYLAEEIVASLRNNQDIRKAIVINEILTRKFD